MLGSHFENPMTNMMTLKFLFPKEVVSLFFFLSNCLLKSQMSNITTSRDSGHLMYLSEAVIHCPMPLSIKLILPLKLLIQFGLGLFVV